MHDEDTYDVNRLVSNHSIYWHGYNISLATYCSAIPLASYTADSLAAVAILVNARRCTDVIVARAFIQ